MVLISANASNKMRKNVSESWPLAWVQDGETIAIDASTTALAMVPVSQKINGELTVVTNGLRNWHGTCSNTRHFCTHTRWYATDRKSRPWSAPWERDHRFSASILASLFRSTRFYSDEGLTESTAKKLNSNAPSSIRQRSNRYYRS